jgi:hypothetical protein
MKYLILLLLPALASAGEASVKCTAAALDTEGKAITLSGVRIYYGKAPDQLTKVLTAKAPDCSAKFTGLDAGTWYFAARSFTADGESVSSNVVTREIARALAVAPVLE